MSHNILYLDDFTGGLDLVSSLSTIPPSFTPNALNFRLSEYGSLEKVAGYQAFATLGGNGHDLAYYEQRDGSPKRLVAALATSWQVIQPDGTVENLRTGLTTVSETTFVQHEDKLYGLDRENIMASWDGGSLSVTTYTTGATTGPKKGIILGVWQNRMWVSPGKTMRVEWSSPEDFTKWPADQYVELGGPGSSDYIVGGVPTPDGLLVFTNQSCYLIYNDAEGDYRLVDSERGCTSRRSLAYVDGTAYGVCRDGVFATNGARLGLISNRIEPLFTKGVPGLSKCAGLTTGNSYLVSLSRSESYNDLTLELSRDRGSFMAFQYPVYAWASGPLADQGEDVFFIDASDQTKIRRAFTGGSFVGNDIACYYETPLNPLGDEPHYKRLRRCRLVGRGAIQIAIRTDYSDSDRGVGELDFPADGGAVWGTSLWDSSEWAGYQVFEGWVNIAAIGRRFTLRMSEVSSNTSASRSVIGRATGASVGGAGVDLVEAHFSNTSKRRQL
jgi:hypothetical protein